MTADTFLLSDTHHDESTDCQVKSILLHISDGLTRGAWYSSTRPGPRPI